MQSRLGWSSSGRARSRGWTCIRPSGLLAPISAICCGLLISLTASTALSEATAKRSATTRLRHALIRHRRLHRPPTPAAIGGAALPASAHPILVREAPIRVVRLTAVEAVAAGIAGSDAQAFVSPSPKTPREIRVEEKRFHGDPALALTQTHAKFLGVQLT